MEIYKNQPKDYDIIEQQKEYAAALRSYKHHMDDQKNALNDAEKDPEYVFCLYYMYLFYFYGIIQI